MLPLFLSSLIRLLLDLAVPAALVSLVLAGWVLRQEGGANFQPGGSFLKYILWTGIFLTVPGIALWFAGQGAGPLGGLSGFSIQASSASYMTPIENIVTNFVNTVVITHLVPILAAGLILKAVLDHAEGHSALGSVIAGMFLLAVSGVFTMVQGWNDGTQFATTNFLVNGWNFLASRVCPLGASIALSAAVISYVRSQDWMRYVLSTLALLSVSGLWYLVKAMVGV